MSRPIDEVLACLENVRRVKGGWTARCPAHDDKKNSLSLKVGDDQRVLTKCHAGCQFREIVDATPLTVDKFFPPKSPTKKRGRRPKKKKADIVATYDYTDEKGNLLFQVCRTKDKQFPQRRPDGKGGWIWGLGDVKPVLYRLPQVLSAIQAGQRLFFVEGEKDADRLVALDSIATTSPMGAGKWRDSYTQSLQGCKEAVLLPDNDPPGLAHTERIAVELHNIGVEVKILQLPNLPSGGDVSDWLDAGGSIAQLQGLVESTVLWSPLSPLTEKKKPLTPDEARQLFNPCRNTHMGNAERLVEQHGTELHFVEEWGWLAWNGKKWSRDKNDIERYYKKVARQIYFEAARENDKYLREELWKWAKRSEDKSVRAGSLSFAESEPGIPAKTEDFDAKPWLLICKNGTVDLRTGELLPHRMEDLSTLFSPVEYNPSATCPTFDAFLKRIMADDSDLVNFIQRAVGYSLTGSTREQCLFILHGVGQNGKSTLINALMDLLGEYAQRTPTDALMIKRGDQGIPNDLARMAGARVVAAVETEDNKRLAEVKIKEMTGGDKIAARFLHREWFEFTPQFKLWLATNHKPVIKGTDNAIWRRIRLIPFDVQIPDQEKDLDLGEKLNLELPGILRWAVEGCLLWQQEGLSPPDKVTKATVGYREEMDVLAAFLADCCLFSPMVSASAKELYEAYKTWCEENGERHESQRLFGERLRERGLDRRRGSQGRKIWCGIGLLADQVTLENGVTPKTGL